MSSKSKSKAKSKSKSKSKKGTNERESRRRQSDHGEKGPRSRSIPKKSSTPIPAKSDATKLKRSPSYRSSLTQRPQRYSFHAAQRTSSGRNLQQSYAAADEMDDIPVISMGILSTPEPEDSPEPPTKPGHKKNAVSSFLSIFSNFSQSRQRKANPYLNSIDAMSDLEVLKRMKRRILDLLSRPTIGIENKKLKKIKAELKSEVWDNEYTELKKRLSIHDIHKASAKQKFNQFTSLKQLSSLHSNDDDEDGVQEMATFLLQEYFDQPSIGPSTSMNTMANSKSQHHQQRIDEEQEEENGDDFGISPRPLSVYPSTRV